MIRKGIYILCTSLALGCCACNDWLTIVPETTLVADNLFETDNGVLQAGWCLCFSCRVYIQA